MKQINPFKKIYLKDENLHSKFKLLRDEPMLTREKDIVIDWIEGFKDRDGKIVREFQETFHSSFWEFYIYAVLKEQGFEIDFSKNRPDFIVKKPYEFYIEAVISNIRDGGKKEEERTLRQTQSARTPVHKREDFEYLINEAIARHSKSLIYKSKKNYYEKLKYMKKDKPLVIALGSYDQIEYGVEFYYSMMALLYGEYFEQLSGEFQKKKYIEKPGKENSGVKINLGIFEKKEFEDISAVMFSCTTTLGKLTSLVHSSEKYKYRSFGIFENTVLNIRYDINEIKYTADKVDLEKPEELSEGLFIFHNPNALRKLPEDVFSKSKISQIFYCDKKIKIKSNSPLLVGRINTSTELSLSAKFGFDSLFRDSIDDLIEDYNTSLEDENIFKNLEKVFIDSEEDYFELYYLVKTKLDKIKRNREST